MIALLITGFSVCVCDCERVRESVFVCVDVCVFVYVCVCMFASGSIWIFDPSYTVITLLSKCWYSDVTLPLHCVVTLLLHCCYTIV
jgi:hypothetical protein